MKSRSSWSYAGKTKIILIITLSFSLLSLTACSGSGKPHYSNANGLSSEMIKELENIDLDGIGTNDDKIVLSYYEAEDKKNTSFSFYEFYFGNGDYVSKKFDGYNTPDVLAADLSGDGKDEIIVALAARSSSYNSSDIHVLEVFGEVDDRPSLVERLTILDGSKDGRAEAVSRYKNTLFLINNESGTLSSASFPDMTDFCGGVTIVSEEGAEQSKLMIYHRYDEQGKIAYTMLSMKDKKYQIEKQGFVEKE